MSSQCGWAVFRLDNKTGRILPFCVQNVFILLGPALFAASIYMCLGRIIRGLKASRLSLIQPLKLTRVFVTGDVLSFLVQGGAAGMMVTGKNAQLGEGLVIGGLMIQVVMFSLFALTAVIFLNRINRDPTPESRHDLVPWKKSMYMLFFHGEKRMVKSRQSFYSFR
ncbi:hypothetical protein diail_3347 [Diaporthe ilicicola]|nr:hypothetical protein diail_3347 [Diaporthe ilicicola]